MPAAGRVWRLSRKQKKGEYMRYKQNLRIEGNKVISYTTHVATIDHANRKLLVHGWWSMTTSKHINHVADTYRLVKEDAPLTKQTVHEANDKNHFAETDGMLKSVAMVAAFGAILCPDKKSKNDWQARMLEAGLGNRGLTMPADWDSLSEDEKERRLEKVLGVLAWHKPSKANQ